MAEFFFNLSSNFKKFFAPFPHFPKKLLSTFIPLIPWYLFLRGLVKIVQGLRSLSGSFQFGSLPKVFSHLLDINPIYLFWDGIFNLLVGILYFSAFTGLAQKKTQTKGWQNWFQASVALAGIRLYAIIFHQTSVFWSLTLTLIGWYLIFEFERVFDEKTITKKSSPIKKKS
ncbi:MAG: hypothetical protein COU63_02845 [Candidatus Pacebacteria bacterium CG10_big_fil_rev_8_21_14_0_10_36_11]|nr:hypothetical protein [Candidatus Pacearchaeota archaeon]OIP74366.1 MAG: hypothetical protein AUK08_01100 [Candidatus Pacebacteria bacterium CG2_30_36_39]PIR64930.1 MAG: hypothetical protein COU63_02845 [Candidatus Pacebacteria bacterium CG10_big_fil_rev_8_21_14_0_10_36_11]PJC42887.1 MAG: hypothetical protein CO040_02100 [Candidatus Pacebacteria bacterium CG_4_9_14_0_2_um_filter_36_8]